MKGLVGFLMIVFIISLIAGVSFRCDDGGEVQNDTLTVESVDTVLKK